MNEIFGIWFYAPFAVAITTLAFYGLIQKLRITHMQKQMCIVRAMLYKLSVAPPGIKQEYDYWRTGNMSSIYITPECGPIYDTSLHLYDMKMKLGPEASGDVIPYIVSVVKNAKEPDMPTIPYTWNETGVDIQTNEYEDEMVVKRIASFFAEVGIKHVGEKNVQKMYESGYDTLLKIIMASKNDFEKVSDFGKKMAERSWDNIHNGLKDLSLPLVLGASGVFGIGIGTKKITTLMNDFPNLLDACGTMKNEDIIERIIKVEGFSYITAKKIVDNLAEAKKFIVDIRQFATFKETNPPQGVGGDLHNMKIVLSGFRDKKLEEDIVARGGKVTTTVSKQTSLLVVASIDAEPSGKAAKAKEFGIQIVQVKDFVNRFIH
jgi:NAD-dependent DNA ligase